MVRRESSSVLDSISILVKWKKKKIDVLSYNFITGGEMLNLQG